MILMQLTAILRQEGDLVSSLCPELDIASEGRTLEEAKQNLQEAVELFLEVAAPEDLSRLSHGSSFITSLEVSLG
jgi:predicted RNase H-like HicB family nuclease